MKEGVKAIAIALLIVVVAYSVFAQPIGPDTVSIGPSTRRSANTTAGYSVPAQAGNVTELFINATMITNRWQGYYGNISGTITLDDGTNNTLYDWKLTNPKGEIYASNGTPVTWGAVYCINFTSNLTDGDAFNLTILNAFIGANESDIDTFNNTFNYTYTESFKVGAVTIDAGSRCPLTYLYVSNNPQSTSFREVLLTDNRSIIFTALLENNIVGFDSKQWDFQMIVGENGDIDATTNYYFFVELA